MTRKEFIKNSAMAGIGSTFLATLFASCGNKGIDFFGDIDVKFSGKIIIVGAGSAGLIAGHILAQNKIDFQIIEASSVFGGRVKKVDGFADFPIDLGAEWIHTEPSILAKLLNKPDVNMDIETIVYRPETISLWNNDKLKERNFFSNFYSEHKFKRTTWYDFFDQYIVPGISDKIIYDSPVNEIDYGGNEVILKDVNGKSYTADKVLVTVPLTILKNQYINFQPDFPIEKVNALDKVDMPDGIKVFMEFSEQFYPDLLSIGDLGDLLVGFNGELLYYNAAFRKDSDRNILGLFSVGAVSSAYANLETDDAIINKILTELDEIFEGKASATYLNHVVQNWSKEPFIGGSYSHYDDASFQETMDALLKPLGDKVYFSGEALDSDSTATVHGAGESSYTVLRTILQG